MSLNCINPVDEFNLFKNQMQRVKNQNPQLFQYAISGLAENKMQYMREILTVRKVLDEVRVIYKLKHHPAWFFIYIKLNAYTTIYDSFIIYSYHQSNPLWRSLCYYLLFTIFICAFRPTSLIQIRIDLWSLSSLSFHIDLSIRFLRYQSRISW